MAIINANFTTQSSGIAVPVPGTVGNDLLRVNDVNPDFNMLNSEDSVLYRILALLAREEDAKQPQFWYFELFTKYTPLSTAPIMANCGRPTCSPSNTPQAMNTTGIK